MFSKNSCIGGYIDGAIFVMLIICGFCATGYPGDVEQHCVITVVLFFTFLPLVAEDSLSDGKARCN